MTARPGHRVRQASAFVALALACAVASAEQPATYLGKPVETLTFTVRGQTIALHTADGGFIPESTDRITFNNAGHTMQKGVDGRPPQFRWQFGFDVTGSAKPTRVRIEQFDKDADTLLVDDATPVLAKGAWSGPGNADCAITPTSPCAAWIYAKGTEVFVFRATVDFDDGTTQVLYQGASFNPDTMTPIWNFLGVKR